jgi:hypothetical protein
MYVCVDTILTHVRRCLSFRPSWLFGKAQLLYSLETSFPLYNRRRRIDGKSKMERKYERGGGEEGERKDGSYERARRKKEKERKKDDPRAHMPHMHAFSRMRACIYTHTHTQREYIYDICVYIYIYI